MLKLKQTCNIQATQIKMHPKTIRAKNAKLFYVAFGSIT